jgi:hypothetical protein
MEGVCEKLDDRLTGHIVETNRHTDRITEELKIETKVLGPDLGRHLENTDSDIESLRQELIQVKQQINKDVSDKNLSYEEKCKLLELIRKYQEHFVTRAGRCNMFEYRFQMQGGLPKSCNSRPIFSLRREVREQIEEMVKNGILEISHSPYVNPLTIIQRKHKPVRIFVDARQVNKRMVPDRAKTPPAHELLQRFHGAKYISSIDLNSAFLQIPLKESSRIWTAFHFEGQTYQFTRVPFGFRNSLASFIRALQFVLG